MALIELTQKDFADTLSKEKTPVLVDFWAAWCGPCRMIAPVFEELSKDFSGKIRFAKVNVDKEQALASMHNVSGIPCMVLFREGKEVDRIVGFLPKEALRERINTILAS